MYNFQNLEFYRIHPTREGILASAKYSDWHYEYNFLIQPDGRVKGKAATGIWLELSRDVSSFIMAKIQSILIEKSNLVYT